MKYLLALRALIRRMGFDIKYFPGTEMARLKSHLQKHKINLVLDVGANTGQYAVELRQLGYKGRIVSFEPQSGAFASLSRKAKKSAKWEVYHLALGEKSETSEMNIAGNSASSSLMKMLPSHMSSAPEATYVGTEKIQVVRLDEIIDSIAGNESFFLKIDTQGFEEKVLNGASGCMHRVSGIQLEMSLVPLYEGEMLFNEMKEKLAAYGFVLCGIIPGFSDPETGMLLQVDGLFLKP